MPLFRFCLCDLSDNNSIALLHNFAEEKGKEFFCHAMTTMLMAKIVSKRRLLGFKQNGGILLCPLASDIRERSI
jgi:hypothetical protein